MGAALESNQTVPYMECMGAALESNQTVPYMECMGAALENSQTVPNRPRGTLHINSGAYLCIYLLTPASICLPLHTASAAYIKYVSLTFAPNGATLPPLLNIARVAGRVGEIDLASGKGGGGACKNGAM
jgi:hypothetical protein